MRWRQTSLGRCEADVDQTPCVLTINDFPEEPLYTITVDGVRLDIDDPPKGWFIESITDG